MLALLQNIYRAEKNPWLVSFTDIRDCLIYMIRADFVVIRINFNTCQSVILSGVSYRSIFFLYSQKTQNRLSVWYLSTRSSSKVQY